MFLEEILGLAAFAFLLHLLLPGPARGWLILAASVLCLFWLQPAIPIRYVDFWLPVLSIALPVGVWLVTLPEGARPGSEDRRTGVFLLVLIAAAALTRELPAAPWLTASLPPPLPVLALTLLPGLAFFLAGWVYRARRGNFPAWTFPGLIGLLVLALVVLKTPALSLMAGQGLRLSTGQNPALAAPLDLRWLGFSYLSFRLIHVLRDRWTGKLRAYDLRTFLNYALFFPSLVAGPIDRLERFAADYHKATAPAPRRDPAARLSLVAAPLPVWTARPWSRPGAEEQLILAARSLAVGLLKKFALADTLALIALNPQNALQAREAGWLWLLLYAYALQIYFDFSGYTDIAIGLGLLLGVRLPDNFASPYLKPNLTQFWNSWHMTLTQWIRAYVFNPLVRALRSKKTPAVTVLLIGQLTTMILIGLWHGVTWNFLAWGLWHGLGLFVQNRWSEWVKPWFAAHPHSTGTAAALRVVSTVLTFHYVALGWVWFVLPAPEMALDVFGRLFGFGLR